MITREVTDMALIYITAADMDRIADLDSKVCVYCDTLAVGYACRNCGEYKGLMTITEWESYTGEVWED